MMTARKTEDATHRRVRALARIFERAQSGVAFMTTDGLWVEVNPALCRLLGYPREELIGRSFRDFTHPDDLPANEGLLGRLGDEQLDGYRIDKRYLHASGREIWVRLEAIPLRDEQGRCELIMTLVQDQTASRLLRTQLEEQEQQLHSVLRSISEGLLVFDPNAQVILANDAASRILGISRAELLGSRLDDLIRQCVDEQGRPLSPDRCPTLQTLRTGQPARNVTMGIQRRDETLRWLRMSSEPVRGGNGSGLEAVVATFSDITEALATERALKESEQRLALALAGGELGLWDWHLDTQCFDFDARSAALLGYEPGQIETRLEAIQPLIHPNDWPATVEAMERHLRGLDDHFDLDLRLQRRSGGYLWLNARGRITEHGRDGKPLRVTGVIVDISERKRMEAQLLALATTDVLTGLLNRRAGQEVLQYEIARAKRMRTPLSLILFDIDHFKTINDRFGHDQGDRVLEAVGGILNHQVRRIDSAVRWGGEEFAVVLPGTSHQGAIEFAKRLKRGLKTIELPDRTPVSASFGVVEWDPGEPAGELLKRADRLMYQAKRLGRNRIEHTFYEAPEAADTSG